MQKKIKEFPKSEDKEFWEDAETYRSKGVPMPICETHGKDKWADHVGYIDNRDGTTSCKYCNWGFVIPGYMRIHNEKVFDLRKG